MIRFFPLALWLLVTWISTDHTIQAQVYDHEPYYKGYIWGLKGGPTLMRQSGHYRTRGTAYGYHLALYRESYDSRSPSRIYFQIGYHQRGSSLTRFYFGSLKNIANRAFQFDNPKFLYHNASLQIGIKTTQQLYEQLSGYVGIGLRGEYTFKTNLDTYAKVNEEYGFPVYPDPALLRHYLYGFSLLLGTTLWELDPQQYEIFAELGIHQDVALQYYQPPLRGRFIDPYTGQPQTLNEIKMRNFSIELSIGVRIYRLYVYE